MSAEARRGPSILRGLEWSFLLIGLAAVDTYIWINTSTVVYQAYQDWAFDQKLRALAPSAWRFAGEEFRALFGKERAKLEVRELPLPLPKPPQPVPRTPARSELIGRLEIPRLHLTAMVLEGADSGTLRKAVGHIPGTALPGNTGNVGLAGHRDTFFAMLRDIRQDDAIALETENGTYQYVVESIQIVGPHDVQVLAASNKDALTLVTCYPFFFVGSAPKRFIVRAALSAVH